LLAVVRFPAKSWTCTGSLHFLLLPLGATPYFGYYLLCKSLSGLEEFLSPHQQVCSVSKEKSVTLTGVFLPKLHYGVYDSCPCEDVQVKSRDV
jgi:hypothetical protein